MTKKTAKKKITKAQLRKQIKDLERRSQAALDISDDLKEWYEDTVNILEDRVSDLWKRYHKDLSKPVLSQMSKVMKACNTLYCALSDLADLTEEEAEELGEKGYNLTLRVKQA